MQEKTYNGWTNYATWRVNLEMLDGVNPHEYGLLKNAAADGDAGWMARQLQEFCESYIYDTSSHGVTQDYALAFMADVNWHEIAEHMIESYCTA